MGDSTPEEIEMPPKKKAKFSSSIASPVSLSAPVSPPKLRGRATVKKDLPLVIASPFKLTKVKDLSATSNIDCVGLNDLLGDPLISEVWSFNYLHDINFTLQRFDRDVRDMIKLKVIHGFWKHEDASRLDLNAQTAPHPNVELITAPMPEIFGTMHSKMLIIFRHDETAQVHIHTANMIQRDWGNMTQAVWSSPRMPPISDSQVPSEAPEMGSGARFKLDLLDYLRAYNSRRPICAPLVEKLALFDFSKVRGALVASVPGRCNVPSNSDGPRIPRRLWGWLGLENVLQEVPLKDPLAQSNIVLQISSIATLGVEDKWLRKTLFKALSKHKDVATAAPEPKYNIIFPTPDEIRKSLDGYGSGGSIHTKIQSPAQVKQLQYLKPLLCHWAGDMEHHTPSKISEGRIWRS
jgi:tyrosyl-DNA phosphodiesterase-1